MSIRRARNSAAGLLAAALLLGAAPPPPVLAPVLDGVRFGETSDALARHFGARAVRLARPIEFGDSYVDVALRQAMVAGYPFTVYFQMDPRSRRLKRVMLERQPHGANPKVFRALLDAMTRDYGPPFRSCKLRPSAATGYQAAVERLWHGAGTTVRAVFRGATLEAAEGCTGTGAAACGLDSRLYVQVVPGDAGCE